MSLKFRINAKGHDLPYNKVQDESAYKFRINTVGHEKLYNVVQDESAEFWFCLGHVVLWEFTSTAANVRITIQYYEVHNTLQAKKTTTIIQHSLMQVTSLL